MKKILFLLCGLAAVGWMLTALAAGEKPPAPAGLKPDVAQLTQQVDSLQAKIKTLEERIAKLEQDRVITVLNPPFGASQLSNVLPIPPASADPNRPPNAQGELEFNGLKYYFMPLSTGGK